MSIYENMSSQPYRDINNDVESEPKKHTREALMRYMNKDKKRSYTKKKKITEENIAKAMIVLMDNGIGQDEADTVLKAIGYTLLDEEIFHNNINIREVYKIINELRKDKLVSLIEDII